VATQGHRRRGRIREDCNVADQAIDERIAPRPERVRLSLAEGPQVHESNSAGKRFRQARFGQEASGPGENDLTFALRPVEKHFDCQYQRIAAPLNLVNQQRQRTVLYEAAWIGAGKSKMLRLIECEEGSPFSGVQDLEEFAFAGLAWTVHDYSTGGFQPPNCEIGGLTILNDIHCRNCTPCFAVFDDGFLQFLASSVCGEQQGTFSSERLGCRS
jgi:hypothetical protein